MGTTKKYWTGLEDLHQEPVHVERAQKEFPTEMSVDEFLGDKKAESYASNRRDFLKFLGFSLGAATLAACEAPVIKSIPYVTKPEEITPGVANWYASTYFDGNDYANVLVKTREGRPIHIKGNYTAGVGGGAVNARVNSSVISLYDDTRLVEPMMRNAEGAWAPASWSSVDNAVSSALSGATNVRLLSNTIASPSTKASIAALAKSLGHDYDPAMGITQSAPAPVAPTDDLDPVIAAPVIDDGLMAAPAPTTSGSFKHVVYDPISYSGIRNANEASFEISAIPSYYFDKADVVVSIGADFLANWLMSTSYAKAYGSRRKPGADMSQHWQFESVMTLTGSNADHRVAVKPSEEGQVAAAILQGLGGSISANVNLDGACQSKIDELVARLEENKGRALVVSGSNDTGVQIVVNKINEMIGAYGTTIDLDNPVHLKQGKESEVEGLLAELEGGSVDVLLVYGVNPCYSHPQRDRFKAAIEMAGTAVSFSMHCDETAEACGIIAPDNHFLESWNDYMAVQNFVSIQQPTITPLNTTRQAQESMLVWAGSGDSYLSMMKDCWMNEMFPMQSTHATGTDLWNYAVHDGGFDFGRVDASPKSVDAGALSGAAASINALSGRTGAWEVSFYQKMGAADGSLAGNPFLQELPDPVSKVTWDNYITMNPYDMKGGGDWFGSAEYNIVIDEARPASMATVTVGDQSVTLPVYSSPGQKRGTVGIALGYGRHGGADKIGKAAYQYGRYGDPVEDENGHVAVGKNVFGMVEMVNDGWCYSAPATVAKVEDATYSLAATQSHHTMMGRDSIVREATNEEFQTAPKDEWNPSHVLPLHEGHDLVETPVAEADLWDAHPVERIGHRWGMSIDLSTCIGCGSCITACNSENNIPVVGKDEVLRSRDMHWMRLDRYYSSDEEDAYFTNKYNDPNEDFSYKELEKPEENPRVTFVPMMCQHCNHAPCETVCPVAATTHSNEGLNQMTYNRCIGTRYCANNCPFKVRRFNWFNYMHNDRFAGFNPAQSDMGRMVLNPDVVVRARGVIEKCSMCVQQIQAGKLKAKKANRAVLDGEIQTACAASCPTNAITFGDYNDDESKIAEHSEDDRAYNMLEEVGVKPNMTYMVKVRNSDRSRYHDPIHNSGTGAVAATTDEAAE